LRFKTISISALYLLTSVLRAMHIAIIFYFIIKLGITFARKVLPLASGIKSTPQGIKGSMHNVLNKGLFIWSYFVGTSYVAGSF
jgi:hypothetical protein